MFINDEKQFLKIKEAAEYLGVTPQTLRNWDKAGLLNPIREEKSKYRIYEMLELKKLRDQNYAFLDKGHLQHITRFYLDTSALIRLLTWPDIKEPGSGRLQALLNQDGALKCTIESCIQEAKRVIEEKKNRVNDPNRPSKNGVGMIINRLNTYIAKGYSLKIREFFSFSPNNSVQSEELSKKYNISFVDASLIVCMKQDSLIDKVLVTADSTQYLCGVENGLKAMLVQNEK